MDDDPSLNGFNDGLPVNESGNVFMIHGTTYPSKRTYYRMKRREREKREAARIVEYNRRVKKLDLLDKIRKDLAGRRQAQILPGVVDVPQFVDNDFLIAESASPDVITTDPSTISFTPASSSQVSSTATDIICTGDHLYNAENNTTEIGASCDDPSINMPHNFDDDSASLVEYAQDETAQDSSSHEKSAGSEQDLFQSKMRELHGIFVTSGVRLNGQKKILKFFKTLDPTFLPQIPIDGRTLRPPQIAFSRRTVFPGEVAYFGVEQMLNLAGGVLFDENSKLVRLSVNMDGVPLSRAPNGIGFWPILGCIKDYPVFVIGAYEGVKKPECANNYLYDFVKEIKSLYKKGLRVHGRTYQFRLKNLIMDGPATSFVTGVKYPTGYNACRRCKATGKYVFRVRENRKTKKMTKHRCGVRYPTLHNEPRLHEDFFKFARNTPDPHILNSTYIKKADEDEATISLDSTVNLENVDADDVFFQDDYEDSSGNEEANICPTTISSSESQSHKSSGVKKNAALEYHQHPTILLEIPDFDLVRDVTLDFMHFIAGHVRTYLQYHNGDGACGAQHKLPENILSVVNARLLGARKYCPSEFQRKPESLKFLPSWKATQLVQFVLYVGFVIFHNIIDDAKLHHFHLLVVAMRLMCRKLPEEPDRRKMRVQLAAGISRRLLQAYLAKGNELYTEDFSLYLAHHIAHMPDDFERFQQPLHSLSAFRYENALRHINALITGHFHPLTQLINKISSLLYTELYTRNEVNRVVHSVEEYYELPELKRPVRNVCEDNSESDSNNCSLNEIIVTDHVKFEIFREIRYRSFKLRTDKLADKYCFMLCDKKDYFIQLKRILKDRDTGEIFLVGVPFERRRNLFTLYPLSKESSSDAGIRLCDHLSNTMLTFSLHSLKDKCFALPLKLEEDKEENQITEWVLTRYLH